MFMPATEAAAANVVGRAQVTAADMAAPLDMPMTKRRPGRDAEAAGHVLHDPLHEVDVLAVASLQEPEDPTGIEGGHGPAPRRGVLPGPAEQHLLPGVGAGAVQVEHQWHPGVPGVARRHGQVVGPGEAGGPHRVLFGAGQAARATTGRAELGRTGSGGRRRGLGGGRGTGHDEEADGERKAVRRGTARR